jgi:hypothetical protein
MTTLREKAIEIGAEVFSPARYIISQMAVVAVSRELFRPSSEGFDGSGFFSNRSMGRSRPRDADTGVLSNVDKMQVELAQGQRGKDFKSDYRDGNNPKPA